MIHFHPRTFWYLFLLFALLFPLPASAAPEPPIGLGSPEVAEAQPEAVTAESLRQIAREYGQITLSVDGLGTTSSSGKIHVRKPDRATVRKAFFMAASTGYTNTKLSSNDVKINGNSVVWAREIRSAIQSYNYWADVTALVKGVIDAAPAGTVSLTVSEWNSKNIDGEILAVIFDDPNQKLDNTVQIYFGAQNISGDRFDIDLGAPIDKSDKNLILDFSLGISYGCQGASQCGSIGGQHSTIDVNNRRLSSAAGGQDDGELANGALITVGGIGDSNANPSSPTSQATNPRSDDELYDLKPFVNDGDRTISVKTRNPSNDDNILFAALVLGATRSVGVLDVDISLYNNPATTEARAPYENIIRYFADGLFEASNGARRLGRVSFQVNGAGIDKADVVWVKSCGPNASVASYGIDGLHINMCDIFISGAGSGNNYDFMVDDEHQMGAGYTLAHEMGHYYFGLYDEYVGNGAYDTKLHMPHSTDKPVKNAIMNSQWNAMAGDNHWLNFSTAKYDTKETAQYRVYAANGWQTLTRPVSDDPRDGDRAALWSRVYYEDLADVAPVNTEEAAIELPGDPHKALQIIWPVAPAPGSPEPAALPEGVDAAGWSAHLSSLLGQNITYPDPILLVAFVKRELLLTQIRASTRVTLPDGSVRELQFADDGVAPDARAGDGLYSALLPYSTGGIYTVKTTFDNAERRALLVGGAFQPTADIYGNMLPMPSPVPVSDQFTLSKTIQVAVGNVAIDDHGDVTAATHLAGDNHPISGKVDRAGDRDVFRLTTLPVDVTIVRITNVSGGLQPRLRLLAEDGRTVIADAVRRHEDKYLYLSLTDLPRQSVVYVEVSDARPEQFGGLYQVSAGRALAGEVATRIRLPFLTRP